MSIAHEQSSPLGFIESRTGWHKFKQLMFLEPLPGGSRWAAAFGSLLLFVFALQIITGILLSTNYSPSAESAYQSVKFIQEDVPMGCFIRAVHHWGSSAMVILLLLHLLQVFVWGAYKPPREFTWMVGVMLLFCTLGLAFTGYLLPWDQKAYWATKVGNGIAGTVPYIGGDLRILIQGGPDLGNLTLTRFFTVHTMVLPGLMIGLIVVHLYFFRLHGVTPPWWLSKEQLHDLAEPFWPKQVLKDAVLWLALLIALGLWSYYQPAPLEAQADPSQPYEARPEWYFMFLFMLLRFFHGPYEIVGTFILPLLFALVLFFWPFIDRNPHQSPRRRPFAMAAVGLSTLGLIGMTIFAIATDSRTTEPAVAKEKATTAEPEGVLQLSELTSIYNTSCAACHGLDGTGNQIRPGMPTIPDFTSLAWQMSQTDLGIVHQIEIGKEPLMPAYREKLSKRQILGLAIYIRAYALGAEAKGKPDQAGSNNSRSIPQPMTPELAERMRAGTAIYRQSCLVCHGDDGKGTEMKANLPTLPDFNSESWQRGISQDQLVKGILDGKGTFMPAYRKQLSLEQVQDLTAYVRAFGPSQAAAPGKSTTDLEKRLLELERQWRELNRQMKEAPTKP